jgi:PleD family two-component response regulator
MWISALARDEHTSTLPSHLIPSRPREAGQKPRAQGLEKASKSNPSQNLLSGAGSSMSRPSGTLRNEGGLMNSVILLVDVASARRDSWKSALQSHNYEVFTAKDGGSALRECLRLRPDLVLLHDTLTDIDSFDLCRRMKANPRNHQTPIVLIKPSSDPVDVARGRAAGAADFWGDCSSFADALSRVQALLRLKRWRQSLATPVIWLRSGWSEERPAR